MRNSKDLSFGSFNLRNLQAGGMWLRHGKTETQENWLRKKEWTVNKIKEIDADVVAFQELWSARALNEVMDAADPEGQYERFYLREDWKDIAVAAIVRRPWQVVGVKVHKKMPQEMDLSLEEVPVTAQSHDKPDEAIRVDIQEFSRSVLQLTLANERDSTIPPVHVFCCHLKSKLPTTVTMDDEASFHETTIGAALATIRRTAEATALRMIINQLMKDRNSPDHHTPIVVMGDLNDGLHSNTVSILTRQPSFRLAQDSRSGRSSKWGLYASGFLDQLRSFRDVNYSHEHKGVLELLDHVLVSDEFYDACEHRLWSFNDMTVWTDHINPFDPDKGTSDHGVLRVRFDWNPARDQA